MTDHRLRVIVTGATGGIGSATVARLLAHGMEVLATGPRAERLGTLQEETGCEVIELDITDPQAVLKQLAGRRIDALVHCAGMLGPLANIYEMPIDVAAQLVNVNLLGTINCLRAVVPGMLARNRGHILLIGSIVGQQPQLGPALYGATKTALHAIARDLRADLYGTDIRVSEILPGRVETGMHAALSGNDAESARAAYYDGYETLQPQDIAESILHVLTAPARVNITHLEILPTHQVPGGGRFWKRPAPTT